MENANMDYAYIEYADKLNDNNTVCINSNGMMYEYELGTKKANVIEPMSYRNIKKTLGSDSKQEKDNQLIDYTNSEYAIKVSEKYNIKNKSHVVSEIKSISYRNARKSLTLNNDAKTKTEQIYEQVKEKYSYEEMYCEAYFEQRPDVKIVYEKLVNLIEENNEEINKVNIEIDNIEQVMLHVSNDEIKLKYDELLNKKEKLQSERMSYIERKYKYMQDIYDYNNLIIELDELNNKIYEYEQERPEVLLEIFYDEIINNTESDSDKAYYSKLKRDKEKYLLMLEKKEIYEQKIKEYICSSITLDDISDELKNYNSSIGKVPAGQWDTWTNKKYLGYGYITGLTGAFEGPQGKETGYDSRKGDTKANYKDPDRSLLIFLSQVTDSNGNILYPMESFEKGGEYYYHIFGVNDDGSINWNLVDNPRFGCKMLGDYLIVGCDQRFNRERGSKVMTSMGPGISFDCGTIEDLEEDPAHIDISMDEVLFWLKNFSHNQDKTVESLTGIYDWCTPEDFDGLIDENYEHMERNYVNNINVTFNTNYICIFDRDDFEDSTSYDSQEEFVYKLPF